MLRAVKRQPWKRLLERLTWEDDLAWIAQAVGYEPTPPQLEVHCDRTRFRTLRAGRRLGKSRIGGFEALSASIYGGSACCGAPTYDIASIAWQEAHDMVIDSEFKSLISDVRIAHGRQRMMLSTGGSIVTRTSDKPRSFLGRSYDLVLFDEAAQEADGTMFEIYARPTLVDTEGAAIIASTPRGADWFKDFWSLGDSGRSGYRSFWFPTSANPRISERELLDLSADMTEAAYRQEILAEFIDMIGAVFPRVGDAAAGPWLDGPEAGARYVLGVDIAQFEDWTVIAVLDTATGRIVHYERFNQIDYVLQERRVLDASARWNNADILIDATNNMAMAQHLQADSRAARVIPFTFTSLSKRQLVNQLSIALQEGAVGLPAPASDLARLALAEFGAYRYEMTSMGTLRTSAPSGKHDDVVMAVCLAYELALRSTGALPFVSQGSEPRDAAPLLAPGVHGGRRPLARLSDR